MKEIDNGLLNHVSGGSIVSDIASEVLHISENVIHEVVSDFQSGKSTGEIIKNSIVNVLEKGLEAGANCLYGRFFKPSSN
ncbi:hypothetical protein PSI23_18660 [Xenorhabdus sp. XENO-10]|uniref:Uncharacterized protein n=1 Tax=Xenorhabdus yunnanensis TaxID=3025878 RepID=A0ABT5LLA3_9GAMM|nr:hypothetical protein [Xenorhabdus yunnanensis]MDC9591253.1 hypothetical protein [Xenorhabdus yunnanensis]